MRRQPLSASVFLSLGLLAACSKDPTQIVVVVDSDLAVPAELVAVRAVVRWTGEEAVADERFGLLGGQLTDARHSLPLSFGIGPGAALDGEVSIEIHALRPGDGAHFVRRAVTRFRPNQTLLLPMFLARECRSVSCGATETCTELGCRAEFVDPGTLQVVPPGLELEIPIRADAGVPRDAGLDPDASEPLDGTVVERDAGPRPDAEVSPDALPPPDGGPDAGDAGTPEPCGPGTEEGEDCGPDGQRCCRGACVDTDVTATACGPSCMDCGPNSVCRDGVCVCVSPFENCDSAPGCEADLSSDAAHCDGCNKPCPDGTSCINRACLACTDAADCPRDNLACTGDPVCDAGVCRQPLVQGWCLIGGGCVQHGITRLGNPCEICNSQSPNRWSPNPGAVCDDGLLCTVTDRCDANGACVGTGSPCPPNTNCRYSECRESTGCQTEIAPGTCSIGNACFVAGQQSPGNPCQICDPARNPAGWSANAGATCNDGQFCTATDRCDANGACVGTGSPCVNRQCGNEVCDEQSDVCQMMPFPGWCFIDGVCVPAGGRTDHSECLECQPAVSVFQFTPVPNGQACGFANICCNGVCVLSVGDVCPLPICQPPCPNGSTCQCDPGGGCTCCPTGQTCI